VKHKIKVTKKDIENGKKDFPVQGDACPISQSLKRILKAKNVFTEIGFEGIWIDVDDVIYGVNDKDIDCVETFIENFDNHLEYKHKPPKPISFEIIKKNKKSFDRWYANYFGETKEHWSRSVKQVSYRKH